MKVRRAKTLYYNIFNLKFFIFKLNILLPSLVALYKSIAPEKDDSSYSASASVVFNIEDPYKP